MVRRNGTTPAQAREPLVDFGLLADESVQSGFPVPARLLGAQLVTGRGDRAMAITGQEPGPWKVELRVCRGRLGIVSISGGFAYPDLYAPALAAVHALHNPSDKRVDIAAIRDVATRGGRWVDLI